MLLNSCVQESDSWIPDYLSEAYFCPYCDNVLVQMTDTDFLCPDCNSEWSLSSLDSDNTNGEITKSRLASVQRKESYRSIKQVEYHTGISIEVIRYKYPLNIGLSFNHGEKVRNEGAIIEFECQFAKREREKEITDFTFQSDNVRRSSSSRRQNSIHRLVTANMKKNYNSLGFLTLTFSKFVNSKFALKQLNLFIKRLRYNFPGHFTRYIWVKEYTKSYNIHFHILFFDWKYISNKKIDGYPLGSLWKQGYIFINKVKHLDYLKVASYISKYMGKEQSSNGERMYSCSRNCLRAEKIHKETQFFLTGKKCIRRYFQSVKRNNKIVNSFTRLVFKC